MAKLPQRLVNVRVRDRDRAARRQEVNEAVGPSTRRCPGEGGCSCARAAPSRSCG